MGQTTERNFASKFEELPLFLTAQDLVTLGIYPTTHAIYKAKARGESPPYIYVSAKNLRFPRDELSGWLSALQNSTACVA